MWTKKNALFLSMILPGASIAFAENLEGTVSPLPAVSNQPNRGLAHVDYLGNGIFHEKQKPAQAEPNAPTAVPANQGKPALAVGATPSALHWVPGESRPILEFRLSDQGSVRLHVSRHSTTAAAQWHF